MRNLQFTTERLEDRRMMAGDVSVNVTGGGDLVVNGDNSGNEVVIRATENADEFLVEGINGTTINGQTSFLAQGVDDDFRINLRNGDNNLLLTGAPEAGDDGELTIPDTLNIRTGNGRDVITLDYVNSTDDATFNTGSGDDGILLIYTEMGDRLTANMGSGNDLFAMQGTVEGRVRTNMGSGDDHTHIFESTFEDDVDFRGGGDDDTFVIVESNFDANDDFDIRGNGGVDGVWFDQDDNTIYDYDDSSIEAELRVSDDVIDDELLNNDAFVVGFEMWFDYGTGF